MYARAKKLRFLVSFAEAKGCLYVRFEGHADQATTDARRANIKEILRKEPGIGYLKITTRLRDLGDTGAAGAEVDVLLNKMMKDGDIIRQEGNLWRLKTTAPR